MHERMMVGGDENLEGLRIDTSANRSRIMSITQYMVYCDGLGLPSAMDRNTIRQIVGVGGRQESMGKYNVQKPFKKLQFLIDLTFIIIPMNVPTLLAMMDMVSNGLDIYIQEIHLSY